MKNTDKCSLTSCGSMTRSCSVVIMFLIMVTTVCMLPSPALSCFSSFFNKMDSKKFTCEVGSNLSGSSNDNFTIQDAFRMLDADFFSKEKMVDIVKEASEFNLPITRADRKLVATDNGGLKYPSVLVFRPEWNIKQAESTKNKFAYPSLPDIQKPDNEEDIAFMSVLELGQLIKTKKISSVELTEIFLRRLKRYNHVLQAVITITEELAYKQAKEADQLLSQGNYLGPLHGIPYGLKDIISVPHYKTTWGSGIFKDRVLDIEAWVYKRLKSTGAVLVAKLVSGSLAYDDIWFGGRTRNPWNIDEFSTGSSAGPAACTSAGMVPFAIGSETAGSITYPSARCGVTALCPTFGTVGRTGVMSISESLAQRARGRLIQEVEKSFSVDAFIGNATDWEKVCMGNLVGMPVIVVPTGFAQIDNPPSGGSRRRKTITTGIYAPPHHDHIALALAMAYQSVTDHHMQHPPIDELGPNDSISNTPSSTYPPRQLRG